FPPGTYRGTAGSALISVTDRAGINIYGAGSQASILKQTGAGNLIDLLASIPSLGINFPHIHDLMLDGSDAAAKAINTNLVQNAVFERLQISSFLDHSI